MFQTHENLEHLAMMEVVLGEMEQGVINRATKHAQKYFKDFGGLAERTLLNWPDGAQSRESIRAVGK